jgi:hypothetical protein
MSRFARIISGGQTGVDRAALDVALELDIPAGGWCPKGRRAEDGLIPERYPLAETSWWGYPQRTEWNVRDSDGTLILVTGKPDGGTKLTIELAKRLRKLCLVIVLGSDADPSAVLDWSEQHDVKVLNVAGPRESSSPGIHRKAKAFLKKVMSRSGVKRPRSRAKR